MTIDGRSAAATDVAKKAPLSAAAAIEANPNVFMIAYVLPKNVDVVDVQDEVKQKLEFHAIGVSSRSILKHKK